MCHIELSLDYGNKLIYPLTIIDETLTMCQTPIGSVQALVLDFKALTDYSGKRANR